MRIAFCFPGQGSQRAGMGRELADEVPAAAAVFEQANDAVGFDLRQICFEGSLEELSRTEVTQPALVAASLAALAAVKDAGTFQADVVVGHSVGEYVAACVAGVLTCARGSHRDSDLVAELAVRLADLLGQFVGNDDAAD